MIVTRKARQAVIAGCLGLLTAISASFPVFAEIEKPSVNGINNFSRSVDAKTFAGNPVAFGGATEARALQNLAAEGYAVVINLRLSSEEGANIEANQAAAVAADLDYVHLAVDPANLQPGVIDRFLAIASDPDRQPVYMHCGSGTRAAALWMIGRMQLDGLERKAALLEGQKIAAKPEAAEKFLDAYLAATAQPKHPEN